MAMFETKIQFKGQERTIKFSSWGHGKVLSFVKKKTLDTDDPFSSTAYAVFFGLIEGGGLRQQYDTEQPLDFDLYDCYDWIDENGGITAKEVERVSKIYVLSLNSNVPKNQKATTEKAEIAEKAEKVKAVKTKQ